MSLVCTGERNALAHWAPLLEDVGEVSSPDSPPKTFTLQRRRRVNNRRRDQTVCVQGKPEAGKGVEPE